MEELVNQLAELQMKLEIREEQAKEASAWIEERIQKAEDEVKELWKESQAARLPWLAEAEEIKAEMKEIYKTILDVWDGQKKTLPFDAGTLKFRTTESLVIENETLVLTGLLDHTSVKDVATNYITGFNKTAVKKYMSVLDLPMGAARLQRKTSVKLEV